MKSYLFALELMDGQERVLEALEMRGFLVEKKGAFLTLSEGSAALDQQALEVLLKKFNIPVFWQGNDFQLLVNRFPVGMMKKITTLVGREFPVNMNDYHFKWRAFANRRNGLKVNTLDLDPYIACFVKAVNQAGVACLAGCDGHSKHTPHLQFSGVYNGAWFRVIQKQYLNDLKLNYKWEVSFKGGSGARLVAVKAATENWDMKKIYEDTLNMAYRLKKHAEEIKEMKISAFKRSKQMKQIAESYREGRHYTKLLNWMEEVSSLGK
jgi:hypothetical protein